MSEAVAVRRAQETDAAAIRDLTRAAYALRLRYEIRHEFAPYIGVSHQRRFGRTADYARLAADNPESTSLVVGIRTWF